MQNQAMRRGATSGGKGSEPNDFERYANDPDVSDGHGADLGLRPGQHYDPRGAYQDYYADPQAEEQPYDPRAYAPNPDEPYDYDAAGNPIYYDAQDRPQARSNRGALIMVGAVLAVAVLGGAGAVAYRMAGHGVFSGEPPLIKADTQPVKTVPEAAAADATQSNKQIYDRVGGEAPQKSKVVSREEQPVDLPASSAPAPNADSARVILPGGPASAATVAPSTNGAEPRRVKTVEIKPDMSYGADAAPAAALAPPAAAPAPRDPIAETAATGRAPRSEFDNGIMSDGAGSPPAPAGAPQLRQRSAAPAQTAQVVRPQAPAPAPQAAAPARPAPAATTARPAQPAAPVRDQQVATAAVPRATAPAAPAPRASSGGGFVVQVTSQRSDADARAAYAGLQRKFPQVLGSYSANIQTATVGDRGTYYRVRVGPFADGAQASTVCSNLRAAGGDCVVSRN